LEQTASGNEFGTDAADEIHSIAERITKIEREIDERVAALYGVPLVSPG